MIFNPLSWRCLSPGGHRRILLYSDQPVFAYCILRARGHVAALNRLFAQQGGFTVNLGTGQGYSVLDTVRAFEAASACAVPYDIVPRRAGDIASCYASSIKAHQLLGWQAEKNLEDMCADHRNSLIVAPTRCASAGYGAEFVPSPLPLQGGKAGMGANGRNIDAVDQPFYPHPNPPPARGRGYQA